MKKNLILCLSIFLVSCNGPTNCKSDNSNNESTSIEDISYSPQNSSALFESESTKESSVDDSSSDNGWLPWM